MLKLRRARRLKDWYRIIAYDKNHYCEFTTGISKQNLIQLREAIDLLLKWEE